MQTRCSHIIIIRITIYPTIIINIIIPTVLIIIIISIRIATFPTIIICPASIVIIIINIIIFYSAGAGVESTLSNPQHQDTGAFHYPAGSRHAGPRRGAYFTLGSYTFHSHPST